ncbi:MAG: plasmid pRiA4b ORF-3 family protein [Betaproteobacteria bacterium]|nr:plasmid pRiA4b ORF-3 family protein [Betaproteobacteria bacterium]
MARPSTKSGTVYCLRIALDDVTPTIWRQVWVESRGSLLNLHHTIQAAMGWTDAHLHQFQIGGIGYATPHPDDEPEQPVVDEGRVLLQKVLDGISSFGYEYDFGDGWQHMITVEERIPQPEHWRGCAFVAAGGAGLSTGRLWRTLWLSRVLDHYAKSRRSKAVREFLQWARQDFDPHRYDRHAANAALLRMAWNR